MCLLLRCIALLVVDRSAGRICANVEPLPLVLELSLQAKVSVLIGVQNFFALLSLKGDHNPLIIFE